MMQISREILITNVVPLHSELKSQPYVSGASEITVRAANTVKPRDSILSGGWKKALLTGMRRRQRKSQYPLSTLQLLLCKVFICMLLLGLYFSALRHDADDAVLG